MEAVKFILYLGRYRINRHFYDGTLKNRQKTVHHVERYSREHCVKSSGLTGRHSQNRSLREDNKIINRKLFKFDLAIKISHFDSLSDMFL